MTTWVVTIVLQVLSVLAILAEFVIPSAGILTVASLGLVGYSLYVAYAKLGPMAGTVLVVVDMFMFPLALIVGIKLLAKSPATLRQVLSRSSGAQSQAAELEQLVGRNGVAATDLRPSGIARLGNRRLDVVTHGDYIKQGTEVSVVAVEGNQIFVQTVQS